MLRTKRWLVIFAALVGLMAHAGALRATSLIFGKMSTSTTTTTEAPVEAEEDVQTTEAPLGENNTSTKPTLTGIPQIDYIWDPNLPRELNGYNLSDYPFYNSVPPMEEIDFKCDGLHDGFYASVKHKCQLYHHCLYGVRYDFLCANFTAFDQKTFICHFVSEVDCKNSPKYYFRNDALYQAASSTTSSTTTTPAPPSTEAPLLPPSGPAVRPRPGSPRRRPLRRRRPQVDYYYYDDDYDNDYYEERSNRRRKQRPRTRRPDYDDDYDERRGYSDDDGYDKRTYNRDRAREDSDDYDYDRRKAERPRNRNRPGEKRRVNEDDRLDRPKHGERRRLNDERKLPPEERRLGNADRRPSSDERRSFNDDGLGPRDRNKSPETIEEDIDSGPPRKRYNGDRRPIHDDKDRPRRRDEDRLPDRNKDEEEDIKPLKEDDKVLVKPSGSSSLSSLFGPRVPPKISRPVPLTERKKFEYTTKKTTTAAPSAEEEYYDEYEDEIPIKPTAKEEKPTKGDSTLPRRPYGPPVKQDQRTRYETVREPEEKKVEKTSPNVSVFNQRDVTRRPYIARIREDSRNRYESIKENEEKVEERSGSATRYSHRDQEKKPYTSLEREDSHNRYEIDATHDDRAEKTTQKAKYRPITRYSNRAPPRKENLGDEEEGDSKDRLRSSEQITSGTRFSAERESSAEEEKAEIPPFKETPRINTPEEHQSTQPEIRHSEEVEKLSSEEQPIKEVRPIVRIVKRPFLPSRGGSPYLPRGLQPVGFAQKTPTTESTPIDMGSTVSGVRLLEHAAPIVRGSLDDTEDDYPQPHQGPRTTQQPQIDPPKSSLEDIYDNEYDVTLNDALNPTLKPLTPNRGYPSGFSHANKFDSNRFSSSPGYSQNSDSYYSSSDVRRSAVQAPSNSRSSPSSSKKTHDYYEDEYEY